MLKRATVLLLLPVSVLAQRPVPDTSILQSLEGRSASISGSASSDVKLTPDRATVRISVQTHGTTAATAAAENATKQSAVLRSLRQLGLPNSQLGTVDYSVSPEYRYENNMPPVLTGYTVTNTIVADIHNLPDVPKVLDSALGSGANVISSLDFYSSNSDAARQQAISGAVAKARAEAQVAAAAAGGSLGSLMSIEIGSVPQIMPPRPMIRMSLSSPAPDATPINPGEQTVTVTVTARWRFMATR